MAYQHRMAYQKSGMARHGVKKAISSINENAVVARISAKMAGVASVSWRGVAATSGARV